MLTMNQVFAVVFLHKIIDDYLQFFLITYCYCHSILYIYVYIYIYIYIFFFLFFCFFFFFGGGGGGGWGLKSHPSVPDPVGLKPSRKDPQHPWFRV